MRRYLFIRAAFVLVSFAILTGVGICQEAAKPEAESAVKAEPKEEEIYGEVLAVNEAESSITVQYYDYDADEEKSIEIGVGQATKLENASALKDIKKGDWVDVSYSAGEAGRKTAKSVKVEKAEEPEAAGSAAMPDEGMEE